MILLNMGWGYYNYPSLIELTIVMMLTLIIEIVGTSLFCYYKKIALDDSLLLTLVVVLMNIISGAIGYLMAFSGIG